MNKLSLRFHIFSGLLIKQLLTLKMSAFFIDSMWGYSKTCESLFNVDKQLCVRGILSERTQSFWFGLAMDISPTIDLIHFKQKNMVHFNLKD